MLWGKWSSFSTNQWHENTNQREGDCHMERDLRDVSIKCQKYETFWILMQASQPQKGIFETTREIQIGAGYQMLLNLSVTHGMRYSLGKGHEA